MTDEQERRLLKLVVVIVWFTFPLLLVAPLYLAQLIRGWMCGLGVLGYC